MCVCVCVCVCACVCALGERRRQYNETKQDDRHRVLDGRGPAGIRASLTDRGHDAHHEVEEHRPDVRPALLRDWLHETVPGAYLVPETHKQY